MKTSTFGERARRENSQHEVSGGAARPDALHRMREGALSLTVCSVSGGAAGNMAQIALCGHSPEGFRARFGRPKTIQN